jgi:hypothetical protein
VYGLVESVLQNPIKIYKNTQIHQISQIGTKLQNPIKIYKNTQIHQISQIGTKLLIKIRRGMHHLKSRS